MPASIIVSALTLLVGLQSVAKGYFEGPIVTRCGCGEVRNRKSW